MLVEAEYWEEYLKYSIKLGPLDFEHSHQASFNESTDVCDLQWKSSEQVKTEVKVSITS